jgi:hypothetical protein
MHVGARRENYICCGTGGVLSQAKIVRFGMLE